MAPCPKAQAGRHPATRTKMMLTGDSARSRRTLRARPGSGSHRPRSAPARACSPPPAGSPAAEVLRQRPGQDGARSAGIPAEHARVDCLLRAGQRRVRRNRRQGARPDERRRGRDQRRQARAAGPRRLPTRRARRRGSSRPALPSIPSIPMTRASRPRVPAATRSRAPDAWPPTPQLTPAGAAGSPELGRYARELVDRAVRDGPLSAAPPAAAEPGAPPPR